MKKVIIFTVLFLTVSILQIGAQINEPFAPAPVYKPAPPQLAAGVKSGPSYVPPPGGVSVNANREVVPAGEGYWIVMGLVITYGIICRKRRKQIDLTR